MRRSVPWAVVPGWTCPYCNRRFGRRNQSHQCEPALSLDRYFADRPAEFRRICDAVLDHLRQVGPLVVDAVRVGVLIKRRRTFAELRPRRDGLMLSILLSRRLQHARIARTVNTGRGRGRGASGRTAHFIPLATADDVDYEVRDWLTEGYLDSPE